MPSPADKRTEFRRLHEAGCFIMPNPWDVGTTRYLEGLGFKALATTSAGAAFALGYPDGGTPLDVMLAHIKEIVESTGLPVNADFENCFADDPAGVAINVQLCIDTGVAGLSIEDSTEDADEPLYEFSHAVERVHAAAEAVKASGSGIVLTARAENFLVGRPDLDDAIRRITAYAEAGADCLYIPGLRDREQIVRVVKAVAPKPINLLIAQAGQISLADAEAMAVRRISTGSGPARTVWGAFVRAAQGMARDGRFDGLKDLAASTDLNRFFREDRERRDKP